MARPAVGEVGGGNENPYRVLFHRLGVLFMRSEKPGVSLYIISFWRQVVVAFSPRGRWIDLVWREL